MHLQTSGSSPTDTGNTGGKLGSRSRALTLHSKQSIDAWQRWTPVVHLGAGGGGEFGTGTQCHHNVERTRVSLLSFSVLE